MESNLKQNENKIYWNTVFLLLLYTQTKIKVALIFSNVSSFNSIRLVSLETQGLDKTFTYIILEYPTQIIELD